MTIHVRNPQLIQYKLRRILNIEQRFSGTNPDNFAGSESELERSSSIEAGVKFGAVGGKGAGVMHF